MAHGSPDNYGTSPQGFVHRVADLAELAARLGSSDTFDRRGNVLFMDGFERGVNAWTFFPSGAGSALRLLVSPVHSGSVSGAILTGTSGGVTSSIQRSLTMPFVSRTGFECSFCLPVLAYDFIMVMTVYQLTYEDIYILRFRNTTEEVSVINALGNYQVIATIPGMHADAVTWYTAKFVADIPNRTYIRALFNNREYDLSAIKPYPSVGTDSGRIILEIAASASNNTNQLFPIDDIILTMNE